MSARRRGGDLARLRNVSRYLWDYRGRVAAAMACLIVGKLSVIGVPVLMKHIVDTLDSERPDDTLMLLALGLVAAYGLLRLANIGLTQLRNLLFARVRLGAMHSLSRRVFSHLHSMSLDYHLERNTGSLSKDLSRSTRSLSTTLNLLVFQIVPTLVEFLLVAAVLFGGFGWRYAAVVVTVIAVYAGFIFGASRWRVQHRQEMNRLDSRANGRAIDSLLNYETVKTLGNEAVEAEAYDRGLAEWREMGVKSQGTMAVLNLVQGSIVVLGVVAILALATYDTASGAISLGDLVLINAMMLQIFGPMRSIGGVYRSLQYALVDMERVEDLLARAPSVQDRENAIELEVDGPIDIEFDSVRFGYLPDRPVLESVNFRVAPGETVAFVGASGAGKSTLARLLFRLYDVDDGAVRVGGIDIRDCTQASLRRILGLVPQDTVMFNDTIGYNLAYGRPDATDEEILHAARAAGLQELLDRLPEGLDTPVGERGLKLSGGEKQRLAIARVLLRRPRILVLDEATSSLDVDTEQRIVATLSTLGDDLARLVVAHRLSTVVAADRIHVLDHGRILESGTHASLLALDGAYAKLWRLQHGEGDEAPRRLPPLAAQGV